MKETKKIELRLIYPCVNNCLCLNIQCTLILDVLCLFPLRIREERPSRMVLTVTEDTPADMLAGSMELLVQLPREHHLQMQRVTVQRSTPMMDLLVQIATAHKLTASNYTLQAIGERGMVLSHQPNTPIGALDALQVKLLPKQGTLVPRKAKQVNQPFETTFRLQVHLPRNQLYVSRVSPKMNLGEILEEVCREKDLDKNKYELRHPASLETLDLSLSLQDYHLQEVTLYARQGRTLGSALSTQDIMALQRQEERRRQQAKQGVFGFVFKKSKEGSLSTDSLGERSASPARSDETGRSTSPLQAPTRPQRKRRPAPKPPIQAQAEIKNDIEENSGDSSKDKVMISHSRNSSDSSGYHEASVLSDNPDSAGRLPETLPRRNKVPFEMSRKLAQTSQSSKSLNNLASVPGTLSHGISNTSLSSTGLRKKRVAPPPPVTRPLSSAISTQALERIVDSEESLTSDMDPSKPPSDIGVPSKANSDIEERPKANSDIGITTVSSILSSSIDFIKSDTTKVELESKSGKSDLESCHRSDSINVKLPSTESKHPAPIEDAPLDARVLRKRVAVPVPHPKPRNTTTIRPEVAKRKLISPSPLSRTLSSNSNNNNIDCLSNDSAQSNIESFTTDANSYVTDAKIYTDSDGSSKKNSVRCEEELEISCNYFTNEKEVFMTPAGESEANFDYSSEILEKYDFKSTNIKNDDDDDNNNDNRTDHKQKLNININKENIENSLNGDSILINSDLMSIKNTSGQEKKLCTVISTMPKCNHLNKLYINDMITQTKEGEYLKDLKKAKLPRTASKSNDFEVNSLEKQKRHLTSHAEDITFALNLNVTSILLPDQSREVDKNFAQLPKTKKNTDSKNVDEEKSCITVGSSDIDLSETDVLLQKVFDTLSNSVSSSDEIVAPAKTKLKSKDISKETEQKNKKNAEYPNDLNMNTSPNLTINSQQDTSDYVSTLEEDLSIVEWEYQLPAPPSAFRDNASPVFDNFEAITPISESLIDTKTEETIQTSKNKNLKNIIGKKERQKNKEQLLENEVKKPNSQEKSNKEQKSESNIKKEVIYELKNKIGILPQSVNDVDSKKISNSSTSKIAPIDITLSNFTITTYSKQKNLNIFEEIEQFRQENSDDKFIRSFATLSRNRGNLDENENKNSKEFNIGTLQGKKKVVTGDDKLNNIKKLEPKIQMESLQRWQYGNEKSNIQRSKSYISICDKPNFQGNTYEDKNIKNVKHTEMDDAGMKKAMSINNLNITVPKNNEKFSQWRDNILKRQENPTKEKKLQSLQVLKSILPQLKNAQQAEENVSKDSNNTILFEEKRTEIMSNEYSKESNVVPTEPQSAPSSKKIESETNSKMNAKRYIYSGPPTINLGSWSERPSANVQIKMDLDYKFGTQQANSKTIVNVNNIKDEIETSSNSETFKMQKNKFEITTSDKNKPNDLVKKLITHTTASGFKKSMPNNIIDTNSKVINDKPIVTGVELKKSSPENKQDNSVIDTTPVNFKELTKAFGQDVCLRSKPKQSNIIQRSEFQQNNCSMQNGHNLNQCLTNVYQSSLKPKSFTSIAVNPTQNQNNLIFRNGINLKGNQLMPVVKGFKFSNLKSEEDQDQKIQVHVIKKDTKIGIKRDDIKEFSKESSNDIPRSPTMPVITGVTLKSARPKSMPAQIDQRDILLESIRNFGGRENLKSATERC
ncbi:cordon-bleu protein-like 1 isoform X4 [Apis dorsata]|uniref:cordon-bleu protein-like 1 isoform X4 n=1 Tax=Apis dorsata TaxID=7462 RepID=UPI001293EF51|nr:cordon-bleu protein-like 1 isoform X4 [Apis dorsata]